GEWELERWIGKKLSEKQIDSCLSSVLKLLAGKDNISGGWGASSTNLPSLYLLKDSSGKWSKVGDLCLELPENLSKLFNRRTIHDEHKNLLNRQLLVQGMSKSLGTPGGLGVPERITEDVILAKLNTLDIHQDGNQRSKILEMMLLSKNKWEVNELSSIDWIPRIDGEISYGEEILLPTDNIIQFFGDNHPWYFMTDIDLSDKDILSRSKELKLMSDTNDVILLLSCLLGPDNVWSGLEGIEILQKLSKSFNRNNDLEVPEKRIGRLPDEQGNWHDDSWLVSDNLIDDYKSIFSDERNIVSPTQIGGKKISEMAKAWILPKICGPTIDQLIDKLADYTDMIGEVDINKLKSLWKLIYKHYEESPSSFPEIDFNESAEFLFPINNKIISLEELIICDESDIEIFESPDTDILTYLDSNHHFSRILEVHFNVVNLDNIKINDVIKCKRVVYNSKFSDLSIQKYWVILSCCRRLKEYVGEEIWLYRTSENYDFTVAKPSTRSSCKALIPLESDSSDEVIRMIDQKLPLFWLPRSGAIQSRIYQEMKNLPGIPFIDVIARPKNVGSKNLIKEEWPLLTKAIQQVLDALIILEKNNYDTIRDIQVFKTKQKIPSKLYASSSPGSKEVFWKESIRSEPMILDFDYENGEANLIISVHNSSILEDSIISEIIGKQLSKDESIVHRLISTNESHWPNIDPLLEIREWQLFNRDLIGDEIRKEASRKMSAWYGQCQICPRQTPSDRQGGFLESTVAIFRQKGGRYYSDSIPNHKGNFMYLCPNHRELYSRSKENKLFWIPILDQAIKELKKNPTKEKANELCNNLLSTEGQLRLKIMTFEKVKPGDPAKENEWNVTWHKNHASGFKDAITQYLMSHVR
ncbi:hypothetical protein OAU60_02270, partial [Euryarchaeota archaeon]|nr:hypothetical protein [Euryarchaeota archaeon]